MFGNLLKAAATVFKPVVNVVNKVVQNIAKNVGGGWFSKGVQAFNNSVNKAASGSSGSTASGSKVAGATGFSDGSGGSAYVAKNKKDKDKDKRSNKEKAFEIAEVPQGQEYRGEAIGGVTPANNTVVIFRSQDDILTEAEEDQINLMLANETDPMAIDVLMSIRQNGIPYDQSFSDYLSRFAHFGWDEQSDYHVQELMNIIMQDRANDQIESLVAFDEDTGFVILDRIGIESPYSEKQYVGLQIEEIEMMRGRDVIFVHNHPIGVRASDEDLAVAWMVGAESVIVVTPEGFEYFYSRGKGGMVYEGKNDLPFEVAPATLEEYNELRALSRQQANALAINRPEYVMYQDEDENYISREDLETINNSLPFGYRVEGAVGPGSVVGGYMPLLIKDDADYQQIVINYNRWLQDVFLGSANALDESGYNLTNMTPEALASLMLSAVRLEKDTWDRDLDIINTPEFLTAQGGQNFKASLVVTAPWFWDNVVFREGSGRTTGTSYGIPNIYGSQMSEAFQFFEQMGGDVSNMGNIPYEGHWISTVNYNVETAMHAYTLVLNWSAARQMIGQGAGGRDEDGKVIVPAIRDENWGDWEQSEPVSTYQILITRYTDAVGATANDILKSTEFVKIVNAVEGMDEAAQTLGIILTEDDYQAYPSNPEEVVKIAENLKNLADKGDPDAQNALRDATTLQLLYKNIKGIDLVSR